MQTFVLSRITNRRVVLRGLNKRIMTWRRKTKLAWILVNSKREREDKKNLKDCL